MARTATLDVPEEFKARPRHAETNDMLPPAAVTDLDVEPRLARASDEDREAMRLLIELLAEV